MRITYLSTYDASDILNWSGTGYHMAKALGDAGGRMDLVGPLASKCQPRLAYKKMAYGMKRQVFLTDRDPHLLRRYASNAAARIRRARPDVVFSPGSIPITYLDCPQKMYFWTDATFAVMVDYYPQFSRVCQESISNGHAAERLALERCTLAFYSSQWAAGSAIEHYGADPGKVRVVPFGANIVCDRTAAQVDALIARRPRDHCRLLTIGVDWWRKGCDLAVDLAAALCASGLDTTLTIVGCAPPAGSELPPQVDLAGFLDKSRPEHVRQFERMCAEAHYLILPSRSECTPMVIGEANSFGTPVLASRVGGIPSLVRSGANGEVFPLASFVRDSQRFILRQAGDSAAYADLARSSFAEYQARLNWEVNGRAILEQIRQSL